MLKINYVRVYTSRKGNKTFVYAVSGDQNMLDKFKQLQGEYYREDEKTGTPLWFTTNAVGKSGTLIITTNNKVIADMSEFDMINSMARQYGGNLGQSMADQAAANLLGIKAPTVVSPTVAQPTDDVELPASSSDLGTL